MDLRQRIIRAEDDYYLENGKEAEYLIIAASDAGELAYEVATKEEDLDEDEAYTYPLIKYREKYICAVMDTHFSGFILK